MNISRRTVLSSAFVGGLSLAAGLTMDNDAEAATGYRFNNVFVFPPSSQSQSRSLVSTIGGNPVTFGYRVKPIPKSSLPSSVASAVRGQAYSVEGVGYIHKSVLESRDRVISANGATWTVMPRGNGTVIVSSKNSNNLEELIKASKSLGRTATVGLPIPVMSKSNPWFPDLSYESLFREFTRTAVRDLSAKGAKSFYLATEMPLRSASYWSPVRRVYSIQTEAIAHIAGGSKVLVSPYFQKGQSPSDAANGALSILNSSHGVNLAISPQDGLGTGTASLSKKNDLRTVDEYFKAMSHSVPRLQATIECMTPGSGNANSRGTTTASSIRRQIDTVRPYVSQITAFMWKDSASLKQVSGNEQFRTGLFFSGGAVATAPVAKKVSSKSTSAQTATKKTESKKVKTKKTASKKAETSVKSSSATKSNPVRKTEKAIPKTNSKAPSKSQKTAPVSKVSENSSNKVKVQQPVKSKSSVSAKSKAKEKFKKTVEANNKKVSSSPIAKTGSSNVKTVSANGDPYKNVKAAWDPTKSDNGTVFPTVAKESKTFKNNSRKDVIPTSQRGKRKSNPYDTAIGLVGTGASALVGASLFNKKFKNSESAILDNPESDKGL